MQQQPWLQNYPSNVPHTIDADAFDSVTDMLQQAVDRFPDHIALECFGQTLTYKELDAASDAIAAGLQQDYGVQKGDRIAVMLPNIFAYPIVMLGILKIGAIQVNVNPLYTPRELLHQLKDSGAEHIFIDTAATAALADIRAQTPLRHIVTVAPGDGAPKAVPGPAPASSLGAHNTLSEMLVKYEGQHPTPVTVQSDDVLFLQYTGGTTGPSKGATLIHRNLVANALQFRAFVADANVPGEECVVLALPMYHIFGLKIFLTYASIGAKCLLIPNPRDMDAYIDAIKHAQFSVIGGVNTLYAGMTLHPEFKNIDFSRFKVAFGGGSKIFASTSERWKAAAGAHILEGFGLSETSPTLTLNPMGRDHFSGTVGYPVPSTDVKILGPDDQPVKPGEVGELCAKGPQIMTGYWGREDATRDAFTEDGYFRTGDVAMMHPDGQFEIVDRKKDMLIVSGFNVYPNEIEALVCELDCIAEAACVGVPDDKTGERVKLFVTPSGNETLNTDDILKYCRANLAAYKVPKEIVTLDELPKSNVGKILRRNLR